MLQTSHPLWLEVPRRRPRSRLGAWLAEVDRTAGGLLATSAQQGPSPTWPQGRHREATRAGSFAAWTLAAKPKTRFVVQLRVEIDFHVLCPGGTRTRDSGGKYP